MAGDSVDPYLVHFRRFLDVEVLLRPLHRVTGIYGTETETEKGKEIETGIGHDTLHRPGAVQFTKEGDRWDGILTDLVPYRVHAHLYVALLQGVLVLLGVHQVMREEARGIAVEGQGVGVLTLWHQAVQGVVLTAAVVRVLILTRQDPLGVEPGHCDRAEVGVEKILGTVGLEAVVHYKSAASQGKLLLSPVFELHEIVPSCVVYESNANVTIMHAVYR